MNLHAEWLIYILNNVRVNVMLTDCWSYYMIDWLSKFQIDWLSLSNGRIDWWLIHRSIDGLLVLKYLAFNFSLILQVMIQFHWLTDWLTDVLVFEGYQIEPIQTHISITNITHLLWHALHSRAVNVSLWTRVSPFGLMRFLTPIKRSNILSSVRRWGPQDGTVW